MKITSLKAGQKVWLGLALVGGVVSFWLMMTTGKAWQEMKQKELRERELLISVADVKSLELEKEIVSENLKTIEEFFLEGETGVAVVAESLEKLAVDSGVSLTLSFEDFPEQVDIGGIYQSGLWIYMEVNGNYQAVLDWVKKVEELPYFLRLSDVKMGPSKFLFGVKGEFKGVLFLTNE